MFFPRNAFRSGNQCRCSEFQAVVAKYFHNMFLEYICATSPSATQVLQPCSRLLFIPKWYSMLPQHWWAQSASEWWTKQKRSRRRSRRSCTIQRAADERLLQTKTLLSSPETATFAWHSSSRQNQNNSFWAQIDIQTRKLCLEFSNYDLTHIRALDILTPGFYTEFWAGSI